MYNENDRILYKETHLVIEITMHLSFEEHDECTNLYAPFCHFIDPNQQSYEHESLRLLIRIFMCYADQETQESPLPSYNSKTARAAQPRNLFWGHSGV